MYFRWFDRQYLNCPYNLSARNDTHECAKRTVSRTYADGLFVAVSATGTNNRVMTFPTSFTLAYDGNSNRWGAPGRRFSPYESGPNGRMAANTGSLIKIG